MPKIVDHDAMRADLVERSARLFGQHGFRRLTMRQIAAELGVSTGTVYHYFANKEALFEAVFASIIDQDMAIAGDQLAAAPADFETRWTLLVGFLAGRQRTLEIYSLINLDYMRSLGEDRSRLYALTRGPRERYVQGVTEFLGLDDPAAGDLLVLVLVGAVQRGLLSGLELLANPGLTVLRDLLRGRSSLPPAG